jgi:hypothetical protein
LTLSTYNAALGVVGGERQYERKIPLSAINHIYQHNSLTGEIVRLLNQDISIGELQTDIEEIGYPRSVT